MNISDLKLYILNSVVLAISVSNVETALKLTLLAVSIVYTVMKIIDLRTKNNKQGDD